VVYRLGSTPDMQGYDRPRLAPLPRLSDVVLRRALTVSQADIAEFGRLSGAHYPVHDDPVAARRHGFDDVIVQGLAVATVLYGSAIRAGVGELDVWFRRPATADAELSLLKGRDGTWAIRSRA
jgi:acyl dehydratase